MFPLAACGPEPHDFPEDEILGDLRILGIRAEPADVVAGETVVLTPLVYVPEGENASYHWELCVVTESPDDAFACANDELGLDEALVEQLDLGTEPTAEVSYIVDPEYLQEQCEIAVAELDVIGDYIDLPDCDSGVELTTRLTVRTETNERIAIRGLFFWFVEPDPLQRNTDPVITALRLGTTDVTALPAVAAAPSSQLAYQVVIGEESRETFVPRSEPDAEPRQEALVYSWFSTHGEWRRERSFADGENFSLAEAGANRIDFRMTPGEEAEVVAVVRDRRGGVAWVRQRVQFVEPTGMD